MHPSEDLEPHDQYRAGHCNIGEKEVLVRKKFFYFFLIITLTMTLASFYFCHSLLCWSGMFITSFSAIVIYLEIKYRYCILFGFFNLHNFGDLGNLTEVKDKNDCRKDRKKVVEIILKSVTAALIYSSAIHLIATGYH